jgi:hypothetical protein
LCQLNPGKSCLLFRSSVSSRGQVQVEAGVARGGGAGFFPTVGVAGQAAEAEGAVGLYAVAAEPRTLAESVTVRQVSVDANRTPQRMKESTNPGPRSAPAGHRQASGAPPDIPLPEIRLPLAFLFSGSRSSQPQVTKSSASEGCVFAGRA